MEKFCPNCGIRTRNNIQPGITGDYILNCPECNFVMRFYILPSQLRTHTEASIAFTKTALTESQRFGGKKRKRKS